MTGKSPAFQWYPDDFLGSGKVGTMTTEEVGVYTLLLCLDWNETGFVFDEEELSRWCRLTRPRFRKAWARVSRCFAERDGRLYNPRLEVEREKQAEWRAKSAKGGRTSGQARAKGGSTVVQPPLENGSQMVPTKREPKGNTPFPTPTPVTTTAKATTSAGAGFDLSPYIDAHREHFPGSDPPAGRYGKTFKRLETTHGAPETLRRWRICLARKATFATPEELSSHWSEYGVEMVDSPLVVDGWMSDELERMTRPANV